MLTPEYATIQQATAAVVTAAGSIASGKFNAPEEIHAAHIIVGYGLSLGFGSPAMMAAPSVQLLAVPQGMALNWLQLVLQLLQMLAALNKP